jgi:hypothetical protein
MEIIHWLSQEPHADEIGGKNRSWVLDPNFQMIIELLHMNEGIKHY